MNTVARMLRGLPPPLGHRDDPSVQRDLNWSRHGGVALPPGLEVQWLGTASFRLSYQGTTVVIDPYVSRVGLRRAVSRKPLTSDTALVERHVGHVDAVLVGHTHFDHAVDVASVVRSSSCAAYGSSSLVQLLSLHGLTDRAFEVVPHHRYDIGPFSVSFVPSRHSKLIAGLKVPSDGELTCDHLDALAPREYRCGQVWGLRIEVGGVVIYHQGSADLIEAEVPAGAVDVFLCGIAGRLYTPRFVERALRTLRPSLVVAHHHDDFFRPVDGEMGFSLNVNLGGFADDVARVAPDVPVRTLEPLQTMSASVPVSSS